MPSLGPSVLQVTLGVKPVFTEALLARPLMPLHHWTPLRMRRTREFNTTQERSVVATPRAYSQRQHCQKAGQSLVPPSGVPRKAQTKRPASSSSRRWARPSSRTALDFTYTTELHLLASRPAVALRRTATLGFGLHTCASCQQTSRRVAIPHSSKLSATRLDHCSVYDLNRDDHYTLPDNGVRAQSNVDQTLALVLPGA